MLGLAGFVLLDHGLLLGGQAAGGFGRGLDLVDLLVDGDDLVLGGVQAALFAVTQGGAVAAGGGARGPPSGHDLGVGRGRGDGHDDGSGEGQAQGGDQNTVRQSPVTSRETVRRNIPTGGTADARSSAMIQALMGGGSSGVTGQTASAMKRRPA